MSSLQIKEQSCVCDSIVVPSGGNVTTADISKIEIRAECLRTYPCQHSVNVVHKDGRAKTLGMFGTEICLLISQLPTKQIYGMWCHYSDTEITDHLGNDYNIDSILSERFNDHTIPLDV